MKLNPTQEKEITDWYVKSFWAQYPADLTMSKHGKRANKGSRSYGLKCVLKITDIHKPEERERILANMSAQVRADRQDSDCTRWPMVSSYLNQNRYDDQFDTSYETGANKTQEKCQFDGCFEDSMGEKYKYCDTHQQQRTDKWKENRKQSLIKLSLYEQGEAITVSELSRRCRSHLNSLKSPLSELITQRCVKD